MRHIHKPFEIPAPSILGTQTFPVFTYRANELFVPNKLSIPEEVQIDSAAPQMIAIHGL